MAGVLLEEMEQQELQVAGAELAGRPELVAAAAAMASVPAEEAAAMAVSAPARRAGRCSRAQPLSS